MPARTDNKIVLRVQIQVFHLMRIWNSFKMADNRGGDVSGIYCLFRGLVAGKYTSITGRGYEKNNVDWFSRGNVPDEWL